MKSFLLSKLGAIRGRKAIGSSLGDSQLPENRGVIFTGNFRLPAPRKIVYGFLALSFVALLVSAFTLGDQYAKELQEPKTDPLTPVINISGLSPLISGVKYYPAAPGESSADTLVFQNQAVPEHAMGVYDAAKPWEHGMLLEIDLTEENIIDETYQLTARSKAPNYLGSFDDEKKNLLTPLALSNNSLFIIVDFYTFNADDATLKDGNFRFPVKANQNENHCKKGFFCEKKWQNEVLLTRFKHPVSPLFIGIVYDADNISEIYSANIGNPALGKNGNAALSYTSDFAFYLESPSSSASLSEAKA